MRRASLRGCLLAIAGASFAGTPTRAMAQPSVAQAAATEPARGAADVTRAKELFDLGAREYASGNFDLAIQAFEQAFRTSPREGIMFSMAQAHRRQYERSGNRLNLERAVTLFKDYVGRVKSGGRVTDAVKALGQLEPELRQAAAVGSQPTTVATAAPKTRIVVNIFVPGTMVSFDDGPPKPPPLSVEIAPGKHKVRLTAPGYFDEERTIGVGEGEIAPANLPQRERPAELAVDTHDGAQISVDGRFVGEAPLSRAIDLPSGRHFIVVLDNGHETFTEDLEVVRGQKHTLTTDLATTTQRDLSFGVFVGAGTLAATGVVLGALAFERDAAARDWLDQRASRTLTRSELSEYEDARSMRTVYTGAAIGTAGGGAALALLGVGLYVFDKPAAVAAPQTMSPRNGPPGPGDAPRDEPEDVEMTTSSIQLGPGYFQASATFSF